MNERKPEWTESIRSEIEHELEHSAVDSSWQLKLFDDSDEDFITKEVERKLYIPLLPNGGDKERKIVERLKKLARNKNFADNWRAGLAIKKWMAVLPADARNAGYYYTLTPPTMKSNSADLKWFLERKEAMTASHEWDKKWFYELMLAGTPEPIADFKIECQFLLKTSDGEVKRLVTLRNVVGETCGPVNLDSEEFHAPVKFRKSCLGHGNFNWGAGEKELGKLHQDIARLAAWRIVNEVVTLGWFPLGIRKVNGRVTADGIWFFGDCARANSYDREGNVVKDEWLTKDADGIYWHRRKMAEGEIQEEGYLLASKGRENKYLQETPGGMPMLEGGPQNAKPDPMELPPEIAKLKELEALRAFFTEFCHRVQNTVGGLDANLMIGSFLSYAAAPEVFAQYSLFPGLWVHGAANSGKSSICELLMEIWGFSLHAGLMLRGRSVSVIGLLQSVDQYSNLPVWGDEFRNNDVDDDKKSALHNGFNRASQAKFNPTGLQRVVRTNFIVSGESTSDDAALRSRYPHIQVAASRRVGTEAEQRENFQWLTKNREKYKEFGRYIMEHRREFVDLVQEYLKSWSKEEIDPRLRIVHGVGYAAWMAMAELLQSHQAADLVAFKHYMVEHSQAAAADVATELNVNIVIEDMITAVKMGAIDLSCFRVIARPLPHPPGAPNQLGWKSYELYIDPEPMVASLQIWLTKQRKTMPLKRKDIRDQLSRNDYWIIRRNKLGEQIKLTQRFGASKAVEQAWGIYADKHPMGYTPVSDEDYDNFVLNPSQGDPRKGPLYELISLIAKKEYDAAKEKSSGAPEAESQADL